MKKIIVFNMVSIDGFYAGVDGDISWHNTEGGEFNVFAIKQLKDDAGMLLFGHTTYDLMAGYWSSQSGLDDDAIIASLMNGAKKVVFSKTLEKVEWENTELVKEISKEQIEKLKQKTEKDLFVFGSGQVCQELTEMGLVDEYRLMINPLTLGNGMKLFNQSIRMKLLKSKEFKNGNVLLYYEVIK
jgi:dihydrofolate reductase